MNYQLLLQLVDADQSGDSEKAETIHESIDKEYVPDCITHKLLLLKYRYKQCTKETRKKLGLLISERESEVLKVLTESNNADIWYLVGEGYASQKKFVEACMCFGKLLSLKSESYYFDSTYPVRRILWFAVRCQNKILISIILNCTNKEHLQNIKTYVLFDLIERRDVLSIDFMLNNIENVDFVSGSSGVTALHMACGSNNFELVKYFLSKNVDLNAKNMLDFTPIESAAVAIAREDGDYNIMKIILEKYLDTGTDISEEVLLSCDVKLQYGPNWIQDQYRKYVLEILGEKVDWEKNDYEWDTTEW